MKISGKTPSILKLNSRLLNNTQVKEETTRSIRKYTELNENKNTIYQNPWDAKLSLNCKADILLNLLNKVGETQYVLSLT